MSTLGRVLIAAAGAGAVGLMGVLLGAWWAPFPAGIAAGLFIARGRWAVLAGALSGLLAWGIPLGYVEVEYGLKATALSLAAIMGFTGAATIPVVLTLLAGTLLGFSGAWFGSVARSLWPGDVPRRSAPVNPPNPVRAAASGSSAERRNPARR